MTSSLVIGIIFLILGLGLRYWINRRKFYRRSPMGAEGFSSYEKSVAIKFMERVGKWIAYALIILEYCRYGYIHERKKKRHRQRLKYKNHDRQRYSYKKRYRSLRSVPFSFVPNI